MSDLHFSAEAHHAAAIVFRDRGLVPPFLPEVLDAALAHDAEQLAREIITKRINALTEIQLEDAVGPATDEGDIDTAYLRSRLLRALTGDK